MRLLPAAPAVDRPVNKWLGAPRLARRSTRDGVRAFAVPRASFRRAQFVIAALVLLSSCDNPDRNDSAVTQYDGAPIVLSTDRGPSVRLVDSILLRETDTAFVGRLSHAFSVDDKKRFLIADRASDKLLRFSPDGKLEAVIGRHGGGPGEFNRIRAGTIFLDDTLLVQPLEGTSLIVIDARTGKEVNRLRTIGRMTSSAQMGPDVALGLLAYGMEGTVALLPRDSLVSSTTPISPTAVSVPIVYSTFQRLRSFAGVQVTGWVDTILVGFSATNILIRRDWHGERSDTILVPVRIRRGVPRFQILRFDDPTLSPHEALSAISMLLGVWHQSTGEIVLWYQDGTTEDPGNPRAPRLATAFLTVLTPDLKQACVDARLEAPGTGLTRLTLVSDTLYSIDQQTDIPNVVGDSVRTLIRRYVIDTSRCDWKPTLMRTDRP